MKEYVIKVKMLRIWLIPTELEVHFCGRADELYEEMYPVRRVTTHTRRLQNEFEKEFGKYELKNDECLTCSFLEMKGELL